MAEEPKHPNDPDRVRLRDWSGLARAVPAAFDPRKLLIAAVALLALEAGWRAIERVAPTPGARPFRALEFASLYGTPFRSPADFAEAIRRPAGNLTRPFRVLIAPLRSMFAIDGPEGTFAPGLARLAWAAAVLGVAGGAICRLAAAEAGGGERGGLREAVGFGFRHAGGLAAAPLYPTAIVLMLAAVSAGFGLIARLAPSLTLAASIAPMVLGLASAALLAFAVASWPLVHAAMAAESEEAVTAIARAYGYVRHRPMPLAACAASAWVLGTLGLAAFEVFLGASAHLAVWGMGLAAFPARPGSIGGALESWAGAFGLALQAWTFAFFWCAAVRAFLILRQDVDGEPEPAPAIGMTAGGSAARL
ncbi:hypothetical protein [Paludisphaera soli]|uniref:hypothetical protein n=1 Tax=Paludisphaera soli TaxID=2712865 RepID=UPI0013EA2D8C|nr:hypothetical protein [Paludisphaera soli]